MIGLLIGGPRDGERLGMPDDRPEVKMRVPIEPFTFVDDGTVPDKDQRLSTCIYRRQEWRDGDRRYVVWVHEDEDDPMARLLAGYRGTATIPHD